MSDTVRENMKRTTQATIDAYNKWDLEAILAPRSDSCVYQFRPLSLKQPARNNSEYREYYATQIIPLLQDFKVRYAKHHLAESWNADGITKATVERTIIDPTERVSIVHCFCQANSAVGQYGPIEVMLMMTLDETGEKVTKMDEFFDSAVLLEFLQRVEAFAQAQQAGQK